MYFTKMQHYETEAQNDHLLFTHVQDVMPVMALAAEARNATDNGWTQTRNMQLIGDIPDIVFFNHPEFYDDDKALRRWLNSEEGQPYRIGRMKHRGDTQKGVIIK